MKIEVETIHALLTSTGKISIDYRAKHLKKKIKTKIGSFKNMFTKAIIGMIKMKK